uniref:Uncharacterized protein n=1 Tax=Parascaris equorum TaxID=6256 RepID=A0A914R432_PAREQ
NSKANKIHSKPQHHYSYNTYTERRTYGRDENGDVVVKIEKDVRCNSVFVSCVLFFNYTAISTHCK